LALTPFVLYAKVVYCTTPLKMLQEADVRVLDLCQRVRQAASPQERRRLMIALRQSWPRVSDPVGLAGEGAYFFGIFGHEREARWSGWRR
jgi:hypothetical protein